MRNGNGADFRSETLILILLWYEVRNALRSTGLYDRIFFVVAGGVLLACSVGNLFLWLHQNAAEIAGAAWIWLLALPVGGASLGFFFGVTTTGVCLSRAFKTFLLGLPLSFSVRRRLVILTALTISAVLSLMVSAVLWLCCDIVHKPQAVRLAGNGALWFFLGTGFGLFIRMHNMGQYRVTLTPQSGETTFRIPGLERLDRQKPAWIGSWACRLPGGRFRFTGLSIIGLAVLGLAGVLCIGASLAQHNATPAVIDAVVSGLGVFMLSMRCEPLGSPVLRSSSLGFFASWLGLVRLPFVLSAIFFVMPASFAIAAEPSSWRMPVGSGISLLLLDGSYAVFAAYFMMAPLVAAISFVIVLSYAVYKWFMYHDLVYFILVIFLVWLWQQARKRFLYG